MGQVMLPMAGPGGSSALEAAAVAALLAHVRQSWLVFNFVYPPHPSRPALDLALHHRETKSSPCCCKPTTHTA